MIGKTRSNGAYILQNGRAFGSEPAIISADDAVLLDVSMQWAPFHAEIYRRWKLPQLKSIDGPVLVLAGAPGNNYTHWLGQMLPRLHLAEQAGFKRTDFAAFVVNSGPPFISQSLQMLGITPERCIFTGPEMHITGNPLVVPTIPDADSWVVRFLRDSFWPSVKMPQPQSPKRIYISRVKARSRKITNEESLRPLLAEYGFSYLCLEDLALNQQVELFANAEVVCGIHGSGLTNVFFSRPGTKLIEIYHPQFPEILWWSFASLGEVEYYFILGEGDRVEEADLSRFDALNHSDVICAPEKMRAIFKMAGL